MDEDLLAELHKLAAELSAPTRRRSPDEWVRGHDAGTGTAGRRLTDLLAKYPRAK